MSATLVKLSGLSLVFAFLIALAIGWGALTNQPPLALSTSDGCDLPCWEGITPGATSLQEAQSLLAQSGYQRFDERVIYGKVAYKVPDAIDGCAVILSYFRDEIVSYMQLLDCGNIQMGDFASILGQTEGTVINQLLGWGPTYRQNSVTLLVPGTGKLSLRNQQFTVLLSTPDEVQYPSWDGYLSRRHYCQRYSRACLSPLRR